MGVCVQCYVFVNGILAGLVVAVKNRSQISLQVPMFHEVSAAKDTEIECCDMSALIYAISTSQSQTWLVGRSLLYNT
jgi:hypothetical protein